MKRKARVIKSHQSEVLMPFKAKKGDIVSGENKPTIWEGWLHCINEAGIYGWVPKAFVTPKEDSTNSFLFIRDYDAFEINALEGEIVLIEETESGWALVKNEVGKVGWIPLENLEYIDQ